MAILGPRGPGHAHRQYTPHDLQGLQRHDDKTNEVIADLEANVEIMSSLCKFYTGLMTNNSIPQSLKDAVELDINAFTAQVENMISDFKMQIARANLLVKITKDRKELVSPLPGVWSPDTTVNSRICSNLAAGDHASPESSS
jgi:hypothetical protein